jgi:hypothetical protein
MEKPPPLDPALEPGPSMRVRPAASAIIASQVDRRAYHLLNMVVLATVMLLVLSFFRDQRLPTPEQLDPQIAEEPLQEPIDMAPFDRNVGREVYHLVPLARYDIKALVVSSHDANTWWDYIHKQVGDFINVTDLCVVWGNDATTGIYREMSFSNSEWSCDFSLDGPRAEQLFKTDGLSNNHILSDDPHTVKALRSLRIGDQIRIKGYLVNYANSGRAPNDYRNTSLTRLDVGDGACEIIYVTDLIVLSAGTRAWMVLRTCCFVVLAICAVIWLMLPYRGRA